MKIINKLKNAFLTVGVFLLTRTTKVLGTLYGVEMPSVAEVYGVERPVKKTPIVILSVLKTLIIPLAFIIGTVIYLQKSKSSKTRKIITLLIALILTIAICFGLNYIINK